jgi:ankyrin repeat protein
VIVKSRVRVDVLGVLGLALLGGVFAPPDAPVAEAAMRGDVEAVRSLLAAGEDVDAAQGDGMTALHWAAERGDPELAALLLDAGADMEPVTRLGDYRPLHLASKGGHATVVAVLLGAGADPGRRTANGGATPLHFAAASGSVEAVAALLEHGAAVDATDLAWGQTPLMFAAAAGRVAAVQALLDAGADPSIVGTVVDLPTRDREDRADQRQRTERMKALQDGGVVASEAAAGSARPAPELPAAPTPSVTAELNEGQRDRVPQPISHAELVGGYGGLTALLLAVREGHTATALALLDAGADLDGLSAGDHTSPLLMATINGHFDLAKVLLDRGADPTMASDAGATPLYVTLNTQWIPKSRHPQPTHATQQRVTYLELMEALLDAGADPNVRLTKQLWFTTFGDDYLRVDRMGATPFWRAAYALDVEAMRLLVAWGADPTVPTVKTPERRFRGGLGTAGEADPNRDPSGLPPVPVGGPGVWPIHAASGVGYGEGFAANIHRHVPHGWLPAVKYLVEELGADVNARDHNGYTPVHHAAARGDNELILYLVERGADVTAVSRRGQTTADMANGPVQRISPFPETVELLESLGSENNHNCVSC